MRVCTAVLWVLGLMVATACSRDAEPAPPAAAAPPLAAAARAAAAQAPTVITPGEWTQDLDAALGLAKQEQLPVFLNFMGSDWCGVCIKAEETIFATPAWKAYARSNLVMVAIDFPRRDPARVPEAFRARNERLAGEFNVKGFPTFILVDAVTDEAVAQLGVTRGMTPADLIREVRHAVRMTAGAVTRAEAGMAAAARMAHQELIGQLEAVNREASAWMATRPAQSAENDARYEGYAKRVSELHRAADGLEGVP